MFHIFLNYSVPFCHTITGTFLSQIYWYRFLTEWLVPFCHRITGTFLSQNYWNLFVTELLVHIPFYHIITGTFVTQSFYIYSTYNGHVIKVREVRNRKIYLRKQVNWLSSDNWSHVGFKGRFQVYKDILQDVTTQYGYYLIDGGSYLQYSKDDVDSIIQDSAAAGTSLYNVTKCISKINILFYNLVKCSGSILILVSSMSKLNHCIIWPSALEIKWKTKKIPHCYISLKIQ